MISDSNSSFVRSVVAAACLVALLALAGCGRKATGPPRFDLSGKVTYGGKPVPRGFIVFNPDVAAGNKGPGAQADIRDGQYQTAPGQGTIGGPHIVNISGTDGVAYEVVIGSRREEIPVGKPLFQNVQLKIDIPKQTAVQDLVVPK
jgi:hypothetical protein